MMDWRVYFDESDAQMDGHGWNVVQDRSAIAARFRTSAEAIAYLSEDIAGQQLKGMNHGTPWTEQECKDANDCQERWEADLREAITKAQGGAK